MVSGGVSNLGCTEFFVELWVKINGVYYSDLLLTQKLSPVTRQIAGNEFVFQQDSAPAHCSPETIELLCRETRLTLFHRNSGHLTVQILDYKIWTTMWQLVYQTKIQTSLTHPLASVGCDSKHACVREADILNTCCKFICIGIRTSI